MAADPAMVRIIAAARAKGIPLDDIKRDILTVVSFVQRILDENLYGVAVMKAVEELNYTCFACKADDHPDCLNQRGPGLPVRICLCQHLMFSDEEKES